MYTGPDVQTLDIILRGWRVTHFDHCEHYGFIADSIQLKPRPLSLYSPESDKTLRVTERRVKLSEKQRTGPL